MNRLTKSVLCAAFLTTAAACSQQPEPANQMAGTENALEASNDMQAMNDPSNPYAQVEMQMHDAMMAARGADVSESWARKMIEHHRGAVEMSNILLAEAPDSRFREMARMTVDEQSKEIEQLERMLRGESASAGAQAPSSPAGAASAPARPGTAASARPASAAKAKSPPPPKASPPPVADPHAGHDMSNMSNAQ